MASPAERLQTHTDEAQRLITSEWYAVDRDQVPDVLMRALVHAALAIAAAVEMVPGGIN